MAVTDDRPAAPPARLGGRVRAVLAAVGVSSLGDGAFAAAVPLAAAAITRDPAAVAAVTAAGYVPWLLVAPFAGALVDRWPYRTTVLAADIFRAAAVAALAVAVAAGAVTVWMLALAAFAVVAGQVFHDTAVQAVVVDLAGRDGQALDRVNGRLYGLDTAGRSLLGPPAGAAAFGAAHAVPFAADAASFAASAALLWRLPHGARAAAAGHPPILRAVKAGLVWLARHRQLRTLALVVAAANLAYNLAWSTFVLYATSDAGLDVSGTGFGLLLAAYAAGGVIIGPLAHRITARVGAAPALAAAVAAHAAAWPLIAATHQAWAAAPLLAAIGACQTLATTVAVTSRQLLVPADMLGRVITGFRTVGNSSGIVGAALGGVIATTAGLRAPLIVAGAALAAALAAAARPLLRR